MGEHGGNINQRPLKIAPHFAVSAAISRVPNEIFSMRVMAEHTRCLFTWKRVAAMQSSSLGKIYTGVPTPTAFCTWILKRVNGRRKKGSEKWLFLLHEKVISTKGISSHLWAEKTRWARSVGERNEWQVLCLFDAAACSAPKKARVIYEFSLFSLILIFSRGILSH